MTQGMSAAEVVFFANDRCDQENVIEQLKNGVNALRMPSDDLLSNWAYMVIAALAWNLKSWYGLLVPDPGAGPATLCAWSSSGSCTALSSSPVRS